MTDLIDRAALRAIWEEDAGLKQRDGKVRHLAANFISDIDAAPTVSCAECKHNATMTAHGPGGTLVMTVPCPTCRCGSDFERRQP